MTAWQTRRANIARAEALATKDDITCPGCGRKIVTPPLYALGPSRWTNPTRWCQRCGGVAALRKETP